MITGTDALVWVRNHDVRYYVQVGPVPVKISAEEVQRVMEDLVAEEYEDFGVQPHLDMPHPQATFYVDNPK